MPTRIIVNPAAGAGRAAARARALEARLVARLGAVEWVETRDAEHVTMAAREAADRGDRMVVAAGGDGTAHFAAAGLIGTETALGVLPVGTGNDFARAAGMPRDAGEAVDVLGVGATRALDVGLTVAAGRPFGCVLGVGMDTPALERIGAARWLRRGRLLYCLAGLETLLTYEPALGRVVVDGRTVFEGELVFAGAANVGTYAGGLAIAPGADPRDGLLDVCVVPRMAMPRLVMAFAAIASGRGTNAPDVVRVRGRHVRIEAERALPVTLDGELTDLTAPIVAEVRPGALRVVGPGVALAVRHEGRHGAPVETGAAA